MWVDSRGVQNVMALPERTLVSTETLRKLAALPAPELWRLYQKIGQDYGGEVGLEKFVPTVDLANEELFVEMAAPEEYWFRSLPDDNDVSEAILAKFAEMPSRWAFDLGGQLSDIIFGICSARDLHELLHSPIWWWRGTSGWMKRISLLTRTRTRSGDW